MKQFETLSHAFVLSFLDCNYLYSVLNLPFSSTVKHSTTRLLTKTLFCSHITLVLISLHWLLIKSSFSFDHLFWSPKCRMIWVFSVLLLLMLLLDP